MQPFKFEYMPQLYGVYHYVMTHQEMMHQEMIPNTTQCKWLPTQRNAMRKALMKLQPNLRVVFGGLNGIELNRYNRWEGRSPCQYVIDDCVTQVNCYVRVLNRLNGNYHPRLTSKVHTWRSGRRVNRYHLLADGLHFGEIVIRSWVWAILRFHQRNTLGNLS